MKVNRYIKPNYRKETFMSNEEKKILSPKLDVVFQILFGEVGSEQITKDLLSTVLDETIETVNLNENIVLREELPNDKMGIVDVLAKINGNEFCNIEMQLVDKKNIIKRLLFYWSKQYRKGIKSGEDYKELKRTIVVLIADFELESIKELEFHSIWQIIEKKRRKLVLTDDLELHIIEMPKMYRNKTEGKEGKLKEWLEFLENPESKEVENYMEQNKNMKEAKEKLDTMSEDAKIRRIAELREKAILDEKEAEYTGYCKGKEDGRAEGKNEAIKTIAKSMKEEGIDIEKIMRVTKLSREEIEMLS